MWESGKGGGGEGFKSRGWGSGFWVSVGEENGGLCVVVQISSWSGLDFLVWILRLVVEGMGDGGRVEGHHTRKEWWDSLQRWRERTNQKARLGFMNSCFASGFDCASDTVEFEKRIQYHKYLLYCTVLHSTVNQASQL